MSRRLVARTLLRLVAVGLAVALTVALAREPSSGAFAAQTGSSANSVSSAADFCTSPGTVTVGAAGDAWIDSSNPTVNRGSDTSLYVLSGPAATLRTVVRFSLPARPAGCFLSDASLRLYNRSPVSGRTIDVYRGDPASPQWTAATVTWANQPAAAGTAVAAVTGSSAGYQAWTVTAHVQAQYTSGNNGFVLRDRAEGAASDHEQVYNDLQHSTSPPQLALTWA